MGITWRRSPSSESSSREELWAAELSSERKQLRYQPVQLLRYFLSISEHHPLVFVCVSLALTHAFYLKRIYGVALCLWVGKRGVSGEASVASKHQRQRSRRRTSNANLTRCEERPHRLRCSASQERSRLQHPKQTRRSSSSLSLPLSPPLVLFFFFVL